MSLSWEEALLCPSVFANSSCDFESKIHYFLLLLIDLIFMACKVLVYHLSRRLSLATVSLFILLY